MRVDIAIRVDNRHKVPVQSGHEIIVFGGDAPDQFVDHEGGNSMGDPLASMNAWN